MDGRGALHAVDQLEEIAPLLGDPELGSEHRLGRRGAEAAQDLRLHDRQLLGPPLPARRDLLGVRLLVQADLPLRLPLEVLHRVRHVHVAAVDLGLDEGPVEELARRADERVPGLVLQIAGNLTHQHQIGVLGPFPEHGLGAELVQVARLTRRGFAS